MPLVVLAATSVAAAAGLSTIMVGVVAGVTSGIYAEVSGQGNFDDGFWNGVASYGVGQVVGAAANWATSAGETAGVSYGAPEGMQLGTQAPTSATPIGDFGNIDYSLGGAPSAGLGETIGTTSSAGLDGLVNSGVETQAYNPEIYGSHSGFNVETQGIGDGSFSQGSTLQDIYSGAPTQLPEITVTAPYESPGYTSADFAGDGTGAVNYGLTGGSVKPQDSILDGVNSTVKQGVQGLKGMWNSPDVRNMSRGMNVVGQYTNMADAEKAYKRQAADYNKSLDWGSWINGEGGNMLRSNAAKYARTGRTGMGPAMQTQAQQQFNANRLANLPNLYSLQDKATNARYAKNMAPLYTLGRMFEGGK